MKRIFPVFLALLFLPLTRATVTTQSFSVSFTCTGSAGPYPFAFPISAPTALTVTENGAVVNPANYTIVPVNNDYENGGSVTLNTACPSGQTVVRHEQRNHLPHRTATQLHRRRVLLPRPIQHQRRQRLQRLLQRRRHLHRRGHVEQRHMGRNVHRQPQLRPASDSKRESAAAIRGNWKKREDRVREQNPASPIEPALRGETIRICR